MKAAIYHQDCPKLPEVGGSPQMKNVTHDQVDWPGRREFAVYHCGACGLEVKLETINPETVWVKKSTLESLRRQENMIK